MPKASGTPRQRTSVEENAAIIDVRRRNYLFGNSGEPEHEYSLAIS
ncbi:MAG: hypothetical protein ACKVHE_13525 [Planctomycetales bacterium]|jgi:hypothetical protein